MPQLHDASREFHAAPAVEIDSKNRDASAYRRELRRGDSGPFRAGKVTEIRNGMPVKLDKNGNYTGYVYRGTGHDQIDCGWPKRKCRCM
jgi:hypothetical protein